MKFNDAKVGDRVYSLRYGWGLVASRNDREGYALRVVFEHSEDTYTLCGRRHVNNITPDLYWNQPTISDDPPPKRKKKVLLRQALLEVAGDIFVTSKLYRCEEALASEYGAHRFIRWCGESIEIEVEEE